MASKGQTFGDLMDQDREAALTLLQIARSQDATVQGGDNKESSNGRGAKKNHTVGDHGRSLPGGTATSGPHARAPQATPKTFQRGKGLQYGYESDRDFLPLSRTPDFGGAAGRRPDIAAEFRSPSLKSRNHPYKTSVGSKRGMKRGGRGDASGHGSQDSNPKAQQKVSQALVTGSTAQISFPPYHESLQAAGAKLSPDERAISDEPYRSRQNAVKTKTTTAYTAIDGTTVGAGPKETRMLDRNDMDGALRSGTGNTDKRAGTLGIKNRPASDSRHEFRGNNVVRAAVPSVLSVDTIKVLHSGIEALQRAIDGIAEHFRNIPQPNWQAVQECECLYPEKNGSVCFPTINAAREDNLISGGLDLLWSVHPGGMAATALGTLLAHYPLHLKDPELAIRFLELIGPDARQRLRFVVIEIEAGSYFEESLVQILRLVGESHLLESIVIMPTGPIFTAKQLGDPRSILWFRELEKFKGLKYVEMIGGRQFDTLEKYLNWYMREPKHSNHPEQEPAYSDANLRSHPHTISEVDESNRRAAVFKIAAKREMTTAAWPAPLLNTGMIRNTSTVRELLSTVRNPYSMAQPGNTSQSAPSLQARTSPTAKAQATLSYGVPEDRMMEDGEGAIEHGPWGK